MTKEEVYKASNILNAILDNYLHGGEAAEVVTKFEDELMKSNLTKQEPVSTIDKDVSKMADEFAEREYELDGYERQWLSKGYYHGYMDAANKSKTEEPVNEDLEKEIERFDKTPESKSYKLTAYHFVQWQKERSKLTWIDMNHIHRYIKDAMNLYIDKFQSIDGQQEVYQNVLERFLKEKKEGLV